MITRLVFLFFCFVWFGHKTLAQKLFVPQSANTLKDEEAYSVIELPHNQYLFVGYSSPTPFTPGQAFVFVTNSWGAVLRKQYLPNPDGTNFFYPYGCFLNADNSISIVGFDAFNISVDAQYLRCMRVDTLLNVLSNQSSLIVEGDRTLDNFGCIQAGQNIFCYATYLDNSVGTTYPTRVNKIIKINSTGTILKQQRLDSSFFHTPDLFYSYGYSINNGSNNGHFYICHSYLRSPSPAFVDFPIDAPYMAFCKMDTNLLLIDSASFNIVGSSTLSDTVMFFYRGAFACSDNNVILGPYMSVFTSSVDPKETYRGYGISKYNLSSRSIVKNALNLYNDTLGSIVNGKNKYICGNYDKVYGLGTEGGGFPLDKYKNHFAVSCYDTSANIKWLKFMGGDAYYNSSNIYGCKDGTVMVMVVRYDFNTNKERDFYIYKLDSATGKALSIRNISEQLRSGISLFPNPAKDIINIKGATKGSQVLLYDIIGRLVKSEKSITNNVAIDIHLLPAGTYSYKIINPDGQKLSSGLWVKE